MRFGLFIPQGWRMDLAGIEPDQHWGVMAGLAERAEMTRLWESAWVYDHFHTVPNPSQEATHEAWTLMAALAAVTSRIRLGQMCTCMGYRNPAYLAKVAATVDIISEGRLEMGIGAGWYEHEWRAYGVSGGDFPSAGVRLGMLDEGVQILRDMWTKGSATLNGKHYQVDGAICSPRPLQGTTQPGSELNGIPMWIAGGGEKKTLRIAAQYADYTNFSADVFEHKSEILAAHCADVGRDFAQITRTANINVVIGDTKKDVEDRLAWIRQHYIDAGVPEARVDQQIEGERAGVGFGTPEQIAEKLSALKALGLSYTIAYFAEAAYDTSGMHLFENAVIPEVR
ncbi:MAG TPA: LLM class F420-dependent oxidoreductase [Dermatophilaceae bacterium]|nr:LLM class F420-dependent oxidoreductase [Dermatophilaceae bacterium]